jgi:D-alanine-D-alanine ligase
MSNKKRIGVFFGGRSGEHEVSLLSARSIIANLNPEKFDIVQVAITKDGQWLSGPHALDLLEKGSNDGLLPVTILPQSDDHWLYSIQNGQLQPYAELDVVFPVLHGTFGEDGTIQGLFEMAGIAYVGAGVLASSVGMDKGLFKSVMRSGTIPVLEERVYTRAQIETQITEIIADIMLFAHFPIFIKPANLGSSVGITKCRSHSDLMEGLMEAARFDRRILVEVGLENAREIEVSVLGNDDPQASLAGEVIPGEDFYTYSAKYLSDNSELVIPARLPEEVMTDIRRTAVNVYKAIDCAGMARVDFLLDPVDLEFYVSEVNTIPGFTRISMYPKLWEATGLPYPELVERLVELAFERKNDRERTEFTYRRDI